jgi:hypothetical protein
MDDGETVGADVRRTGEQGGERRRAWRGGSDELELLSTSQRGELPMFPLWLRIRGSVAVSISACHVEDPG